MPRAPFSFRAVLGALCALLILACLVSVRGTGTPAGLRTDAGPTPVAVQPGALSAAKASAAATPVAAQPEQTGATPSAVVATPGQAGEAGPDAGKPAASGEVTESAVAPQAQGGAATAAVVMNPVAGAAEPAVVAKPPGVVKPPVVNPSIAVKPSVAGAAASGTVEASAPGAAKPAASGPARQPERRLFGTVEFRGTLDRLPKWTAVLRKMRDWQGYFQRPDTRDLPSRGAWVKLKAALKGAPDMERLKAVNRFFNQWPYRLDMANYGVPDYWASPPEFLKKSGDCEDYAIAKFYALKELGFPGDRMRIVAVRDRIRNIGHAVLAVYLPDDIYILDNQTVMVLPHTRYKHYLPQYSVNEKYRWMHVPVSMSTAFQREKGQ